MSRVLLTGGLGFVGRQIRASLAAAGHDVTLVVRTGARPVPDDAFATASVIETPDLFQENAAWWAAACADMDAVIHAAWYAVPGKYPHALENLDCVAGTVSLAHGALQAGVKHFVGIGTCLEYRLPSHRLDVTSPLDPKTLYGACKLSTYHMLREWFPREAITFSWCRLFFLHGAGERPERLVPYLRRQFENGQTAHVKAGTQVRDFLDVERAGAMIAHVVDSGQPGAINICSGIAVTIRQLAERIADEYGRRDLLEFAAASIHPSDPATIVGICNAIAKRDAPERDHESTT